MADNKKQKIELPISLVTTTLGGIVGGFFALILTMIFTSLTNNYLVTAFYAWGGISIVLISILSVLYRSKLIQKKKFSSWW